MPTIKELRASLKELFARGYSKYKKLELVKALRKRRMMIENLVLNGRSRSRATLVQYLIQYLDVPEKVAKNTSTARLLKIFDVRVFDDDDIGKHILRLPFELMGVILEYFNIRDGDKLCRILATRDDITGGLLAEWDRMRRLYLPRIGSIFAGGSKCPFYYQVVGLGSNGFPEVICLMIDYKTRYIFTRPSTYKRGYVDTHPTQLITGRCPNKYPSREQTFKIKHLGTYALILMDSQYSTKHALWKDAVTWNFSLTRERYAKDELSIKSIMTDRKYAIAPVITRTRAGRPLQLHN